MARCPECGYHSGEDADECELCGAPLGAGEEGRPAEPADRGTRPSGAAGDGDPSGPIPWEDSDLGIGARFWRTWRESLFDPAAFFGRVRDEGGLLRPLLYALIAMVPYAATLAAWPMLTFALAGGDGAGGDVATGMMVVFALLVPVLGVLGVLFNSGGVHDSLVPRGDVRVLARRRGGRRAPGCRGDGRVRGRRPPGVVSAPGP